MTGAVCAAITGRRRLRFEYDGRERIVEPYGHGWTTAGAEIISGYQIGGHSVGGQVPGWKMFHVAKMTVVRDAGGAFARSQPDYEPGKLRISALCCRVESDAPVAVRGQELPERLAGVTGGQV